MGHSPNSLTSCIYELALGRGSWDNLLDVLAAAFPECLVLLSGDDVTRGHNLVFAHRGLDPAAAAAYTGRYGLLNPWLDGQTGMTPGQIYHDDQLLPRATAARTPFVSQWLDRQGDFRAATGVVILREGLRQLALELRYPERLQAQLRERAATILGEAAQHFGRAFEILQRSRFSVGQGYLETVVEDLPFAVFFLSEDMRIHYANFHADALRRQPGGPFSGADGMLRALDAEADAQLRQLVMRTAGSKRAPTTVLQLTRPHAEARFFAIARLATRGNQHFQLHDAVLDPGPLVILVVHGSLEVSTLPPDLLWRAFSLTESEALLAEALLNGATLADFAREREVSKQTLRNQLVGVMRKTGTRRQSELVSLLTRLSLTCL